MTQRELVIGVLGCVLGGVVMLAFNSAPTQKPLSCPEVPPVQARVSLQDPVPVLQPPAVAASSSTSPADDSERHQRQIAKLEEALKQQDTIRKEALGDAPIEPPQGLPTRFFDGGALSVLVRDVAADAGISAGPIELLCEEYPCLARIRGIATMNDGFDLISRLRGGAFAGDRKMGLTVSFASADGGTAVYVVIGFIPAEEPADRQIALKARAEKRGASQ